jgi:formylglycine-generating enzyme required for sulfatase activity
MYRFRVLLILSLLMAVLPVAYGQVSCCDCNPMMVDGKKAYDNEYWGVAKAKFTLAADVCKGCRCTLDGLPVQDWIAKCDALEAAKVRTVEEEAAREREAQEAVARLAAARPAMTADQVLGEIAANMVRIAGGTYQMGDVLGDKGYGETVHNATVNSFSLGQTEVTQAQYAAVMGSNPSYFRDCDQCPVEQVSWEDAQAFIQKLNQLTAPSRASGAAEYRLPTEAEWEYAAREGGKKVRFGNGKDTLNPALVNFNGYESYQKPYSIVGQYREKTTPAKSFSSNVLGLYDMSGNVYEWCQDGYGAYPSSSGAAYTGPASSPYRVSRGGGWSSDPRSCRAASRTSYLANTRTSRIGIRLCCSAQ